MPQKGLPGSLSLGGARDESGNLERDALLGRTGITLRRTIFLFVLSWSLRTGEKEGPTFS